MVDEDRLEANGTAHDEADARPLGTHEPAGMDGREAGGAWTSRFGGEADVRPTDERAASALGGGEPGAGPAEKGAGTDGTGTDGARADGAGTNGAGTNGASANASGPGFKFFDKRFWARGEVDDEEPDERKPTYVEELERRLAEAEAKLKEYIQAYKEKTEVEWNAAKRRMERDFARQVDQEVGRILADLVEVLDNLELSLDSARQAGNADALIQGVSMVRDMFLSKLKAHGVEVVSAEGQPFDPAFHEAVGVVTVEDPSLDGRVVDVLRPGYLYKGKLIRPAMVRLGRLG